MRPIHEQDIPFTQYSYDTYKQFHYTNFPFVYFNTGEFMCLARRPIPGFRMFYPQFNVQLAATSDSLPRIRTIEGQIIPRAWMHEKGIQYLALDHETKLLVALANYQVSLPIPANKRRAAAYWASETAVPIADTVEYWETFSPNTNERAYMREITRAAKVISKLTNQNPTIYNELLIPSNMLTEAMKQQTIPTAFVEQLNVNQRTAVLRNPKTFIQKTRVTAQYLTWD